MVLYTMQENQDAISSLDEVKIQGSNAESPVPALDIIVAPDDRLRLIAKPTVVGNEEKKLIDEMFSTMKASNGIGLAAIQVGIEKRIITVDVPHLGADEEVHENSISSGRFALINPVITNSEGIRNWIEGCLSVPGFHDEVKRASMIDVIALDVDNNQITIKASGLLAACIQHEIDHLDGKLFIDKLSKLKRDIVFKKLRKFRKRGYMIVRPSLGLTF